MRSDSANKADEAAANAMGLSLTDFHIMRMTGSISTTATGGDGSAGVNVEFTDEPQSGDGGGSKLRDVTITISGTPSGTKDIISYPRANLEKDGKHFRYSIPTYTMTVSGTDDDGKKVTQTFQVIRFGVKNTTGKTQDSYVEGLKSGVYKIKQFKADYHTHSFTSPQDGAWVVSGPDYIHAGPGPGEISGSNGCVEVCGENQFINLNKLIINLSGLQNAGGSYTQKLNQIANAGILTAIYQPAMKPKLIYEGYSVPK
jgi:hypothetical protein